MPLAKRLICLGGCYPLLGQLQVEDADKVGKTVIDHLGLRDVPSSEMAQRLLDQPIEDFWMKIPPNVPMLPIIDGIIIPQQINFETLAQDTTRIPGKQWIDGVMLGDSELDVSPRTRRLVVVSCTESCDAGHYHGLPLPAPS